MERLRPEDGTKTHRNCASYHLGACRRVKTGFHQQLHAEMDARYRNLITRVREVEDAEDARAQTLADVDAAEIDLENSIRDLEGELGILDRTDATLNARLAVFPNGFGPYLEPEGGAQLDVLPTLRSRVEPFQGQAPVAEVLARITAAENALRTAIQLDGQAVAEIEARGLAEQAARQAVREQLDGAYGRLRDHYRARPGMAERFFLKNPRGRKRAKAAQQKAAAR